MNWFGTITRYDDTRVRRSEPLISIYRTSKREVGIGPAANCEAKEEAVSYRDNNNVIDKTRNPPLVTFRHIRSSTRGEYVFTNWVTVYYRRQRKWKERSGV